MKHSQIWCRGVLQIAMLVGLVLGCGDNLPVADLICSPTAANCDGVCRTLQSDPNNCGTCGAVCSTDQVCGAGACASACPLGTTACDGGCVNLDTDVDNCGACGTACSTDNGDPLCAAAACGVAACEAGYFASGSTCQLCSASCADGQFESVACSTAADRTCTACPAIAGCSSVSCTNGTDAVCDVCDAGSFWSGTACETCSTDPCPAGTFETAACSGTANRICGACTAIPECAAATCTTAADQVCLSCDAGTYLSGNACLPCSTTSCPVGSIETTACSATADRTCGCTPITDCANESCTTPTDQTCLACDAGTYLSGNACLPCSTTACPVGSIETTACSANADRICGCTPIAGCATEVCTTATDQTCLACDAGTYLSGNACLPCSATSCPVGSIEMTACSATADRTCGCTPIAGCANESCTTPTDQTCLACDAGTYLSGNACLPCSTAACPVGSIETTACSANADRICGCTPIADCANEFCTTATDQTCLACDAGTYLSGNACATCSTTCPTGSIETTACSATADRICGCTAIADCANESCTTASDQTCLACDAGFYLSNGACVACTACRSGEFQESACTATADRTCATTDCYTLHVGSPSLGNGVYAVDPDGLGGAAPFQAYCDMTSAGGGWTMLMKVDGSLPTFTYQAALWTNTSTYQPDEVAFDVVNETKSFGFATMPFNAIRVGLFDLTDGVARWLHIPRVNGSLLELFTSGFQATVFGRDTWKSLVAAPSLQVNCNREGFNVMAPNTTNVRIGIMSNQENDCSSPDSRIGIGTAGSWCGQVEGNSAGNEARCGGDAGDRSNAAFGFVMVRNCPGGICACGPLTSCDALCVDTQTDRLHCGSCTSSCGQQNAVATCVAGSCQTTCNLGFTDCDGVPDNGCEANFDNDNANCGACNNQCAVNLTCSGGACLDLTSLEIDNPNGAVVEYLPRDWGNKNALAEGTCTGDCTVYPTVGNTGHVRLRSSTGFASGCDNMGWQINHCYVSLPAHVIVN